MSGLWWKLLFVAGCALQANGASAQGVCNYNNPASPNYCSNADVIEQKARFRSLNDDFTKNATSEADRTWRDAEFDQMRSSLSGCASQPENFVGCQFQVYRKFSDALEGRLEWLSKAPSDSLSMPSQVLPAPDAEAASDAEAAPDAAAEAQKAAQGLPPGTNATREGSGSISVVDQPPNVSTGPHFEKKPYNYRKLFKSIFTGALLWIVLCGPLAFRAARGYSGITERKVLLVISYFLIISSVSETIEFLYWILIWFPIAIWGPRITAYPIRRRLLKFYGFEGPDFDDEFDEWRSKHAAFWANFRYGMASRGQSNELAAIRQLLSHNTVGKCRAGLGHKEVECGKCEIIGCLEPACSNYNFSDNNTCLECGHRAPITGGY